MLFYVLFTEVGEEDIKESKVHTASILGELLVQIAKKKVNYNYSNIYMLYQGRTKCYVREEQVEEKVKDGVQVEVASNLRTKA